MNGCRGKSEANKQSPWAKREKSLEMFQTGNGTLQQLESENQSPRFAPSCDMESVGLAALEFGTVPQHGRTAQLPWNHRDACRRGFSKFGSAACDAWQNTVNCPRPTFWALRVRDQLAYARCVERLRSARCT